MITGFHGHRHSRGHPLLGRGLLGLIGDPANFDTDFDMGGLVNLSTTTWDGGTETFTINREFGPSNDPSMNSGNDKRMWYMRIPGMTGRTPTFVIDDMDDTLVSSRTSSLNAVWCYEGELHNPSGNQWRDFDNETYSGVDNQTLTVSMNTPFTSDTIILGRRPCPTFTAWEAKVDAWVADANTSPIAGGTYAVGTLSGFTGHAGKAVPDYNVRAFKIGVGSKAVCLLGNPHADEGNGHYMFFGYVDFLLSDHPLAVQARANATFYVYPNVNGQTIFDGIPRSFPQTPWINGNQQWDTLVNDTTTLYKNYWSANHPVGGFFASIEFHDLVRGDQQSYQFFVNTTNSTDPDWLQFLETVTNYSASQRLGTDEDMRVNLNTDAFEDRLMRAVAATEAGGLYSSLGMAAEVTTERNFTVEQSKDWGRAQAQALSAMTVLSGSTDTTAFYQPTAEEVGEQPIFARDLSYEAFADDPLGFDVVSGPSVELVNANTSGNDMLLFTHLGGVDLRSVADAEYYVRFSVADADENSLRFYFRSAGGSASTQVNYTLGLQSGGALYRLRAVRRSGGSFPNIQSVNIPQLSVNTDYDMRVQLIGTALRARLWLSSDSEPGTWTVDTTDSNITAAGATGIYSFRATNTNIKAIGVSTNPATTPAPTS